jgi:MFS family permease
MTDDREEPNEGAAPELVARRREDRNVRNLYRHTIWQGIISAVIGTFLPIFAVRVGASTFEIGMLTSLPALVAMIVSIPAVPFLARQRNLVRTVSVTMLGVWFCAVVITFLPSLMGESDPLVPVALVAIWGVAAIFSSMSGPAWTAVLADAVSGRRRPVVNGQRWALLSVVGAGTTAFAGWYLDAVSFPRNYQSLIIISFLTGLIGLTYLERLETQGGARGLPPSSQHPWHTLAAVPSLIRSYPVFRRFVLSTFVYRLGMTLPAALFPIFWVDDLGASDTWIGIRAMAGQAALVVSYALWGRLAGRSGHHMVMIACGVGFAVYPALTGLVPSPFWLVPVALVWGFFAGGIDVSFFEGLVDAIPADQRLTFAAVNTAFANLSILIGPLLGILLVELIGMRTAFFVSGAVCLVGAFLFYVQASARHEAPALELQTDAG